jgi:hypothetical protein
MTFSTQILNFFLHILGVPEFFDFTGSHNFSIT